MSELLLKENPNRYVLFPIQYDDIWAYYKKHLAAFWSPEEIDLTDDIKHWEGKLNKNEKHFISTVLAFFAASDGIVLENLGLRFFSEVQIAEVRQFYSIQIFMEGIHSETYSLLIDTLVEDKKTKAMLFNAVSHFPCVKKKASWALKYIESCENFATRLIAFICVEGLFFSASFCAIFWLKKRGLMPGLSFSNELISRDEGIHCDFAILLYTKYITNKLQPEKIYSIFAEAVTIEKEFSTIEGVKEYSVNYALEKTSFQLRIRLRLIVKFEGVKKELNIEVSIMLGILNPL